MLFRSVSQSRYNPYQHKTQHIATQINQYERRFRTTPKKTTTSPNHKIPNANLLPLPLNQQTNTHPHNIHLHLEERNILHELITKKILNVPETRTHTIRTPKTKNHQPNLLAILPTTLKPPTPITIPTINKQTPTHTTDTGYP